MTDKSVVQSWSRPQLESAFTQREGQLETVMQENVALRAEIKTGNGLYYELQQERDQLKQQLAQAQWGTGYLSPDEAKRLEADAAAMRKALGSAKLRVHEGFDESGSHYSDTCELCRQINKALSTTAGRSLLERLERYEKALEAAKPILKSCFVGPPPDQRKAQDVYEFTREALKGGEK